MQLSVVVPIYNEEDILWNELGRFAVQVDGIVGAGQWQFVLVDNGSRDKTPEIVRAIVAKWPQTVTVNLPEPNYGLALRVGLEHAEGPWAHIINVEQWDIPFLAWAWAIRDDYDVILGSKRADPTLNFQSPYRRLLSWGLNSLLSLLFEYVAIDSHGPKVLRMETMRPIFSQARLNRGQFDTEFSIRALRARLRMVEAPMVYREIRPARNFMISKIVRNVIDIIRLWRILRNVPYSGTVRFRRFNREDVLAISGMQDVGTRS